MSAIYKSYETERLILKPTTIEDAAFVHALLNSPKWIAFIGDRNVKTIQDAENYIIEKMMPQLDRLGYGNYTVIRKSDGIKIGSCGLYDRDGLDAIDIGYAFLPAYEKMGYAFESSNKIMELAIHTFKINKILAITSEKNQGSRRLLEKLGLQFEKMVKLPNDDEELMLFKYISSEH